MVKCCVTKCGNKRKDAILYKIPRSEGRHNLWLRHLRLEPTARLRVVCQKHFEKRFIGPGSRLLQKAYPSLFKPHEICTGIPDDDNTESIDPHEHEHSYAAKQAHLDHSYCKAGPSSELAHHRPDVSDIPEDQEEHINENELAHHRPDVCDILEDQERHRNKNETALTQTGIKTPTKYVARKRIIGKFQNLTPTAQKIYKEYKDSKSQNSFLCRARRALKFSKDASFENLTQSMNPYAKKFLNMQMKMCKKKKHGRRFTLDEKLISLAILKQGPKCYRFLHRIFILPSVSTLNKLISNLEIEVGINCKLFDLMTKEVTGWKPEKKYCSIIFDEMALGVGVSYNQKKDKMNGFVELNERKNKFADHVLVFMLRGAIHKWQQPIGYYFCEGATKGLELKKIIKDVVEAVSQTGLKPIVLGCDQGTAFQAAIKSLKEDTKRDMLVRNEEPDDTISIGNNKLHVIYDPSHLIKGIRNNFLNKDIVTDNGKISKWQDIVDIYKTDCGHTDTRLLHKLNDEHVIPEKIKKMKVKNCVKVLSKTVAAALSYTGNFSHYVDGKPVSSTIKNTSETVSFFDDLFDSINGASLNHKDIKGKALRSAVHKDSKHHTFWPEAINILRKMRFIDSQGRHKYVPTLKNFICTIQSYIKLWQYFKTLGIKVMRPRYFNTDPIENFFGQVRAYNYRNNDPTCHNFINTFKALTITRILNFHSESFNCEEDLAEPLLNIKSLFEGNNSRVESVSDEPVTFTDVVRSDHLNETSINITNIIEQARRERLSTHSRAYVTGWVLKKYLCKISCKKCTQELTSTPNNTTHQWISQREYNTCKKSIKLCYPSEKAVRLFGTIQNETNEYLENNAHKKNIKKQLIENIFSKYSFDLVDCSEHEAVLSKYFMDVSLRFGIFNWCNRINKILNGVDVVRLKENNLPYFQELALRKYKKKFNKRSKK